MASPRDADRGANGEKGIVVKSIIIIINIIIIVIIIIITVTILIITTMIIVSGHLNTGCPQPTPWLDSLFLLPQFSSPSTGKTTKANMIIIITIITIIIATTYITLLHVMVELTRYSTSLNILHHQQVQTRQYLSICSNFSGVCQIDYKYRIRRNPNYNLMMRRVALVQFKHAPQHYHHFITITITKAISIAITTIKAT